MPIKKPLAAPSDSYTAASVTGSGVFLQETDPSDTYARFPLPEFRTLWPSYASLMILSRDTMLPFKLR